MLLEYLEQIQVAKLLELKPIQVTTVNKIQLDQNLKMLKNTSLE